GKFLVLVFAFFACAPIEVADARELLPRSAPRQLRASSFAACLREVDPAPCLGEIRASHRLGRPDLLLLYLSVYPDVRLPGGLADLQELARERWSVRWNREEGRLA